MKLSLILLAGLCALAISSPVEQHKVKVDKEYITKQKHVLELFEHINQPSHHAEHVEIAKSYHFEDHVDKYTKPEVVKHFMQHWKYGMLPRGEIFSIMYHDHMEEAIALFELFYYAKDYDTFYKTAVWARQNVNEGMFLYAYSVAMVHRPDTYGIILPPIYEIYPHYFFSTETIHQAYTYKQRHHGEENHQEHQEHEDYDYTIYSNYSGHYLNLHPEQSMSYFLEDVGLNAFYYYYNLYYPFWMDGKEYKLEHDKRGEQFYYMHQQLLARYYLERLSNGFGEIPYFNWEVPFETAYVPSLQYPNGLEFPSRPKFANLFEYFYNYGQSWTTKDKYGYSPTFVKDCERRINDAIDFGYVFTHDGKKIDIFSEDGMNILGNLIEGNPDSPHQKFYKGIWYYARHLLGYAYQPLDKHHVAPSALEHFETSLRDPAFFQLYKKIILKFYRYKMHLPPYTEKDLVFQGVKVVNVEFDRLVTFFEKFSSDITNAVYFSHEELQKNKHPHFRTIQYRLNHQPFNYKITVKSEKATKAVVKIFLGPKHDEYGRHINMSENRMNMVQFDHFTYDLKAGENVITRKSQQNYFYGPDRTSYHDMYKKIMGAKNGDEYQVDGRENYFYFPQRYMLPKGTPDGMTYQFYVMVYEYEPFHKQEEHPEQHFNYPMVGTGGQYIDGYSLGYPFDRHIKYEHMWEHIPNSYFYETKIYHKHSEEDHIHHHVHHDEHHH
ncbi:hypothetical protein NQ315_001692 [Exocentrus adspersus]|uniref:Uncharacterized protein n=1 Tax=Exocentrus adspersus TaxID=1586481 RepID=A0AAV8W980_9CUCU|nr:hypothetical protein NQ315_001692 [Exocentrus adspersus]